MGAVDADDRLLGALTAAAAAPRLLVACGFDGALAAPVADPADARAEQPSSEALNVLLALPGTWVAVVSGRPADEVAELMFLSGSKGGTHRIGPDGVAALRRDLDVTACVAVDADPATLAGLGTGDLRIAVGPDDGYEARHRDEQGYRVGDAEDVADVLSELVRLRRS